MYILVWIMFRKKYFLLIFLVLSLTFPNQVDKLGNYLCITRGRGWWVPQIKSVDGTLPNDVGCAEGGKISIYSHTYLSSVQFNRSVVSNSLWSHGLQHARLPCPLPSPVACSNSCLLSQWSHPTISPSFHPLLLLPSISPSIRVFSSESAVHIRWPKYWSFSFSISPSNEYSGLISFRIDWFSLLAVHD